MHSHVAARAYRYGTRSQSSELILHLPRATNQNGVVPSRSATVHSSSSHCLRSVESCFESRRCIKRPFSDLTRLPAGMPRQTINLEAFKPQIEQWLADGLTADEMRRNLWREGGIQISSKTFSRRLREWNIYVKQPYMNDIESLKKRVRELFEEGQLTDVQAVAQLKREGFDVRAKTYQKMRKEMGLYKRSLEAFKPMHETRPQTGAVAAEGAAGAGEVREDG